VRDGRIPATRLESAVQRVLAAKTRFGILNPSLPDIEAAPKRVGTPEHREMAQRMAAQAMTVLRDEPGLLPLPPGTEVLVAGIERPSTDKVSVAGTIYAGVLQRARELGVRVVTMDARDPSAPVTPLLEIARQGYVTLIAAADLAGNPGQIGWARSLAQAGLPVIVAGIRGPYELAQVQDAPVVLATYDLLPSMIDALFAVLYGRALAQGRLPVELPEK
jgi:beta-N-acetylhexosaminidase